MKPAGERKKPKKMDVSTHCLKGSIGRVLDGANNTNRQPSHKEGEGQQDKPSPQAALDLLAHLASKSDCCFLVSSLWPRRRLFFSSFDALAKSRSQKGEWRFTEKWQTYIDVEISSKLGASPSMTPNPFCRSSLPHDSRLLFSRHPLRIR